VLAHNHKGADRSCGAHLSASVAQVIFAWHKGSRTEIF
jgi:hypothetical protein